MKQTLPGLTILVLLAVVGAAGLAVSPGLVAAQVEETPILGAPTIITPIVTSGGEVDELPGSFPDTPQNLDATRTASEPTATTTVGSRPDRCEPNNLPEQPCLLPLDAVSGPFTIVPEDDQDFFQLDLPQEAAIQTTVIIRATRGLDLILIARQGATLLASSPVSLTLDPSISGLILLRVENRDPRPAAGETYRVEVRRSIAPPSTSAELNPGLPDDLENNWSFATAAPIAVGVVYDLTLVCPEARPDACPGGDHDYLLAPVKAGVTYRIATFDLDPGVDTVIEVFWQDLVAVAGSDDYGPGGMLSALTWTAPADGLVGIRIAPRNGGLSPHLEQGASAGYRFAIAPVASELAQKLEATLREQANLPTPIPTAVTSAASSSATGGNSGSAAGSPGGATSASQETIASGPALILRETVLRREPDERATALANLLPETRVMVRGPVSGLWVSVETEASILPGWVRWSDLRREQAEAIAPAASPTGGSAGLSVASPVSGSGSPASQQSGAAATPRPAPAAGAAIRQDRVTVTQLDPALPPPPAAPAARVPLALTVVVVATDRPPSSGSTLGFATPTPDMRLPVPGVRVQLLTVFGDVLAEGLTDAQGVLTLSRDVRPGDALRVRMPAWGVEVPLAAGQAKLVITIPEAQR